MQSSEVAALSRIFSSSVIKEMSRFGKSPLFSRLATESKLFEIAGPNDNVGHLFEYAFSILRAKANRHEYIYKSALTQNILLGRHSLQTASLITEFRVGTSKADIVILNGTSSVYEIKSERDTLSRLEGQIASYRKVFATVNVIAGENHLEKILATVPDDVGIMLLSARHQISTLREAVDRPERTEVDAIFNSIRLDEAKKILAINGLTVPNVPNTQLSSTLYREFIKLTSLEANQGMVKVLKETRDLMPLSGLVAQLPKSLRPAALFVQMRKSDHNRLLSAVKSSANSALTWR